MPLKRIQMLNRSTVRFLQPRQDCRLQKHMAKRMAKNAWQKCMAKMHGKNAWGKYMGKIHGKNALILIVDPS